MRTLSNTDILARWFVETFLNQRWDYRVHQREMRAARDLVNPVPDPETNEQPISYTIAEAQGACLALRAGKIGPKPISLPSLRGLFWGTPAYIEQYTKPPERPDGWDHVRYDEWVRRHGGKSIQREEWDGLYVRWTPATPPGKGAMTLGAISALLGVHAVCRSVYTFLQRQDLQATQPLVRTPPV